MSERLRAFESFIIIFFLITFSICRAIVRGRGEKNRSARFSRQKRRQNGAVCRLSDGDQIRRQHNDVALAHAPGVFAVWRFAHVADENSRRTPRAVYEPSLRHGRAGSVYIANETTGICSGHPFFEPSTAAEPEFDLRPRYRTSIIFIPLFDHSLTSLVYYFRFFPVCFPRFCQYRVFLTGCQYGPRRWSLGCPYRSTVISFLR